jgi:predicted ATPase
MRLSLTGAANTGKTSLLQSFLHTWKTYKTPEKTYRDIIEEKQLEHSSKTTTETQTEILNFITDQQLGKTVDDDIIYDRCTLDVLAYTIWAHEKGLEGFDTAFVNTQIKLVKESLRSLDIIFICKFNENMSVEDDGKRDANKEYIVEINNIIESLYQQYKQNIDSDIFFPKDDSPCLIKLPDSMQQRVDLIAEYVAPDGGMHSEEDSVLNPNNINELEQLLKQQTNAHESEKEEKELFKKFGLK